MTDTEPGGTRHMSPADAHVYAVQINGLLHDLQHWQREHPNIGDYRSTMMIQCLAKAAASADLLVRKAMAPEHAEAAEKFRIHVLDMDPQEAADLRVKEAAANDALLAAPYPFDTSAGN